MLENKLQEYLKEKALLSPSYYIERPFLKEVKDGFILAIMSVTRTRQIPQKEAILDEDTSKFYESIKELHNKYVVPATKHYDTSWRLLKKLGYDESIFQLKSLGEDIIERYIKSIEWSAKNHYFDGAIKQADQALNLNQRHNVGVDVSHRAYGSIIEALIGTVQWSAKNHYFDDAIKQADQALNLNQRHNVGVDVSHRAYGSIIEALIGTVKWYAKNNYFGTAFDRLNLAYQLDDKHKVG